MDKAILNIINERQLTSVMNKTKWRKLATAIQSITDFNPLVREKCIGAKDNLSGFAHYDWECLRLGSSSEIEWLEIDPIKKIRRGQLVDDNEIDYSVTIENILKENSIPYSIENHMFKVWGYVKSSEQPKFV